MPSCATVCGRAAQTATVRQVGENRYSGNFCNAEYSISGVKQVVVRGSNQTLLLNGSSVSAVLNPAALGDNVQNRVPPAILLRSLQYFVNQPVSYSN